MAGDAATSNFTLPASYTVASGLGHSRHFVRESTPSYW